MKAGCAVRAWLLFAPGAIACLLAPCAPRAASPPAAPRAQPGVSLEEGWPEIEPFSDGKTATDLPGRAARWEPGAESGPDRTGYDALQVELSTEILFAEGAIAGEALWTLEMAKSPPAVLAFDFFDNMIVTGASLDGVEMAWEHAADSLRLTPPRVLVPGETLQVRVSYHGQPERGFLLGFAFGDHGGVPVAYTNSEPAAARSWWPCKDRPDEKFTAELEFIVPDSLAAASNGVLTAVTPLPGGRAAYHWSTRYPLAAYLVSVIATNFVQFEDRYAGLDGREMPLTHFAFPEDLEAAQRQWAVTPVAMRFFAETFGEYPFIAEKYGMAEFPWSGAMEHQTLTSMGAYFLQLPNCQDWVVVHELAHQWWGDWVTCGTWRDIWLNEGFAVYSEALWAEHLGGPDSLRAQMRANTRNFRGSVYDPDFIFNSTVYRKGAWVLHMLRHVVGDADFFRGLRKYGDAHAFGAAVTEDLRATFAEIHGDDLRWFFDPWVYGEGMPLYGVWWEALTPGPAAQRLVRVRVVQEPVGSQYYKMPLDALFMLADGAEFRTVLWDSLPDQEFFVALPAEPVALTLDPDEWVLCRIYYDAFPSGLAEDPGERSAWEGAVRLGAPHPNPTRGALEIPLALAPAPSGRSGPAGRALSPLPPFLAPAASPQLGIFDSAGRLLRRLSLGSGRNGEPVFSWDGRDPRGVAEPSGVYFARWLNGAVPLPGSGEGRAVRILLIR